MPRGKIDIDEELVAELAEIHCTDVEIGHIVGCSPKTLTNRFSDILTKGRSTGKRRLRRKQYDLAVAGNAVMCIWLGKQELGQADKQETKIDAKISWEDMVKEREARNRGGK